MIAYYLLYNIIIFDTFDALYPIENILYTY